MRKFVLDTNIVLAYIRQSTQTCHARIMAFLLSYTNEDNSKLYNAVLSNLSFIPQVLSYVWLIFQNQYNCFGLPLHGRQWRHRRVSAKK